MTKPDSIATATERVLSLHVEEVIRVRGVARLRVVRGMLWVTLDADPDDHVLVPGESFTVGRGARALVQAFRGPAGVAIAEAPPSWPQRAAAALQAATQRLVGVRP